MNRKDELSNIFSQYGRIEVIVIFNEKCCNECAIEKEDCAFYAYVTFKKSHSAYLALKDSAIREKYPALVIVPADSWKQPKVMEYIETDRQSTETLAVILNLNDKCLLKIFGYIDLEALISTADACIRFKQLIIKYIYPEVESIVFNFDDKPFYDKLNRKPKPSEINAKQTTLADMRKKLLAVGQYVKSVKLIFFEDHQVMVPSCQNVKRIIEVFVKLIGRNLNSLTILGILLTAKMKQQLCPIFHGLKYLEWNALWIPTDYHINLISLCPNLEILKIFYIQNESDTRHWEKLEHVTFSSWRSLFVTDYALFLQNNSQLKSLRFSPEAQTIEQVLSLLTYYQKQLEKLVLAACWGEIYSKPLNTLAKMKNMKVFKLLDLHDYSVNLVLDVLCNAKQLNYLKITSIIDDSDSRDPPLINHEKMAQLAKSLRNLNKLSIRRCKLLSETICAIVKNSRVLEIFDLRECDVVITRDLIQQIFETRKALTNEKKLLKLLVNDIFDEEIRMYLSKQQVRRILMVSSGIKK